MGPGTVRTESGMTLLEVMVSTGIMVFCLAGMLLTYSNFIVATDISRAFTLANGAAQKEIERLRITPFSNITNSTFIVPEMSGFNGTAGVTVEDTEYSYLKYVLVRIWFRINNRQIGSSAQSPVEVATYIGNFT